MVSTLDSGSSSPGLSPGRGHCVVFLGNLTLKPLSTQEYKWVLVNLMLGGKVPCNARASHPGGSRNTLSCFMLRKPG